MNKFFEYKIVKIFIKIFLIIFSLIILLVGLDLIKYSLVNAFDVGFFIKLLGSPVKSFFLSYLMTEITMSGSPIAGAFIGLGETLKIPSENLMSIILGTRGGVNSVLLITGLLMLFKGKSLKRALGITVIQFFVTLSVTLISSTFVFKLLDLTIFSNIASLLTSSINGTVGFGYIIDIFTNLIKLYIPDMVNILIIGFVFLIGGLFAFDKNFSFVKDKKIANKIKNIENTRNAFLAGFIITALTMSLSVSVTLLLPLYVRKVITRRHLIPYILGANISTLFDTLFLAIMTDSVIGIRVILAFITATIISVSIILFGFQYFRKFITYLTDTILNNKYYFILFLIIIMFIPILFLFG